MGILWGVGRGVQLERVNTCGLAPGLAAWGAGTEGANAAALTRAAATLTCIAGVGDTPLPYGRGASRAGTARRAPSPSARGLSHGPQPRVEPVCHSLFVLEFRRAVRRWCRARPASVRLW